MKLNLAKALLTASALFLAGGSFAQVADPVQAAIHSLTAQGYTHFQVKRLGNRTKIEAFGAGNAKTELTLRNADGAVLRQETKILTDRKAQEVAQHVEDRHNRAGGDDNRDDDNDAADDHRGGGPRDHDDGPDHGDNDHGGGRDDNGGDRDDHDDDH